MLDGARRRGADARRGRSRSARVASAAVMLMTEDAHVLELVSVGDARSAPAVTMTTGVGVNWSLLSLGSGMLVGLRINVSMLLGTVARVGRRAVRAAALRHHRAERSRKNDVLFWVMWPATGMMVAGGLTALVLRWRLLVKTFRNLSAASVDGDDFPLTLGRRRRRHRERRADRRAEGQPRARRLDDGRRDPAVAAADARRPARARRDQLGADQRAVEHDAGDLRRARARAHRATWSRAARPARSPSSPKRSCRTTRPAT